MPASRLLLCLALLSGCGGTFNRAIRGHVLPALASSRDLGMACSFGETAHGLTLSLNPDRPPADAMTIAGLAGGVCTEREARELELQALVLLQGLSDPGRGALATDRQVQARRFRSVAAARFQLGYLAARDRYGNRAPHNQKRQGVYLLGLLSGALALVNDSVGGGTQGVPQNQLLDIARDAEGLDDARWWGVPQALRGAAWAVVPGSAPEGVDPWALLADAALQGEAAGQRVARALQVFTLVNAGRTDALAEALGHPLAEVAPAWPLFDAYAAGLVQFELDRLWIQATGHRADQLGVLPPAPEVVDDPFGEAEAPMHAPAG